MKAGACLIFECQTYGSSILEMNGAIDHGFTVNNVEISDLTTSYSCHILSQDGLNIIICVFATKWLWFCIKNG